jgi:hypothetical protein
LTGVHFSPFVGVEEGCQEKERRLGGGRFWIKKVLESFLWFRKEEKKGQPTVMSDKRGSLVLEGRQISGRHRESAYPMVVRIKRAGQSGA